MADRSDLVPWLVEALTARGGSAVPLDVTKEVWRRHEEDLRAADDLFFTWQYDLRWAATKLRQEGVLAPNKRGEPWSLAR